MSARSQNAQQRKVRSVARRYKRDGYVVTVPADNNTVPPFLQDHLPDLIAESASDRVVIEVKPNHAVRGANDLRELAERVAQQPGWRLELVTVADEDLRKAPPPQRLEAIESRVSRTANTGATDLAYAYTWMAVEQLLSDVAAENGLILKGKSTARTARELVSHGILTDEQFATIRQAQLIRNRLVHAKADQPPSQQDVSTLLALARDLYCKVGVSAKPITRST